METSVAVTRTISRLKGRLARIKEETCPQLAVSETASIQRQLDTVLEDRSPGRHDRRSSIFARSSQIRLPKIEFCSFSGDLIKWPEFWDSFEAAVDRNEDLQPVEKLSYLRSKLDGDAITTIEGLQTTNENYDVAVSLLKSRYGNTQLLITTHYSEMMELLRAPNITFKLRELHNKLEKHLRSLEALGEDTSHRHFVSLIMAKLPWQVIAKIEESKDDDEEWTVNLLRKKLKSHLAARETADRQCPVKNCDYTEPKSRSTFSQRELRPRGTTEALFAGDKRIGKDNRYNKTPAMTTTRPIRCIFCSGSHYNDECRGCATLDSRKNAIKGRCYICLSDQHLLRFCNMRNKECVHCRKIGNHHRSLCPLKLSTVQEPAAMVPECIEQEEYYEEDGGEPDKALLASGEHVLLQTALCTIKEGTKALEVRMLLDSGSHRSYISEKLAQKLNLQRSQKETVSVVTFGSNKPKMIETRKAEIFFMSNSGFSKTISVNIVPKISGNISRAPVSFDEHNYLWKTLPLADSLPKTTEASSIDCLIGSDYYMDLVTNEKIKVKDGLYLLGSKLGWILTGRTGQETTDVDVSLFINSYVNSVTPFPNYNCSIDACLPVSPNLEDLWALETIGIKDQIEITDDDEALKQFSETVSYRDGRYYVGWPKKEKYHELQQNFGLAQGRFVTTCRRLASDQELLKKYDSIIKEQEGKGVVEKVNGCNNDDGSVKHYIPHHPVISPKKVRIVYDASAKPVKSATSLNECLLREPVILQDLCGLLLRFRLHKVVLLADIEKAFLQVGLNPEDRDVTRFLWLKDGSNASPTNNTQVYRFCRVPFGIISSPFLLAATVKHHLQRNGSAVAMKINQDLYVDNVVTGVEDTQEAVKLYKEAKQIFNQASMNLREWSSNDKCFVNSLPEEDKLDGEIIKVLGLKWNTHYDTIGLSRSEESEERQTSTRRAVLKSLAANFDPLGFFVPVTLSLKILLQKLWDGDLKWDDDLPKDIEEEWIQLKNNLTLLPSVAIPRYLPVVKSKKVRLLCFCDASAHAYAATVYLQYCIGRTFKANLLMAKSRIAPKRKLSIPRLELLATVIGSRILKFAECQLRLGKLEKVLWTDSKCVLHWIKSKKSLSVFVENRVKEIRNCRNVEIRYVKTTDNPADIATKPQLANELTQNSLWWEGPIWLSTDAFSWPQWDFEPITTDEAKSISEEHRGTKIMYETGMLVDNSQPSGQAVFTIQVSRFSNWMKLLRVTALVLRFLRSLNPGLFSQVSCQDIEKPRQVLVSAQDISEVKQLWERNQQQLHYQELFDRVSSEKMRNLQRQLNIKQDEYGLLRCYGRFSNAEMDEDVKTPKLLPRKCHFTNLIIQHYHRSMFHAGVSHTLSQVRTEYWIPGGRSAVKSVIARCLTCRREDGGPFKTPPMPPLPSFRVNPTPPFSITGVDYFGPMYIKTTCGGSKKVWISLFTCLCIRAIHLEVVEDLSGEQFLFALRKFIARRGCPAQIISDNAPQFKVNDFTLQKLSSSPSKKDGFASFLSNKGITWKFIPEFAPWMGGFYERLIGIVKRSLKKAIGKPRLTLQQLAAILAEVESVVNSRPLIYIGGEFSPSTLLSTAQFLCLNPRQSFIPGDLEVTQDPRYDSSNSPSSRLTEHWIKGQKLLQSFWDMWEKQYLLSLRERHQTHLKRPKSTASLLPAVGQVVLIKDGESPRSTWKAGRILDLVTSNDGACRSVKLRMTNRRTLIRPIRNLFPLELDDKVGMDVSVHTDSTPCSAAQSQPQHCTSLAKSRIPSVKAIYCDKTSNDRTVKVPNDSEDPLYLTPAIRNTFNTVSSQRSNKMATPSSAGQPSSSHQCTTTMGSSDKNGHGDGAKAKRKAFLSAKEKIQNLLTVQSMNGTMSFF